MSLDKGHGRIEQREIWTSTALNGYLKFPHLQQVFCIERSVTHLKKNYCTREIAYGLTSLTPEKADASQLLKLNRDHWSIESHHYVRDVTFDEDRSRVRKGTGPRMMASLRNAAIGLLRMAGANNIAKTLRHVCLKGWEKALRLIGIRISLETR